MRAYDNILMLFKYKEFNFNSNIIYINIINKLLTLFLLILFGIIALYCLQEPYTPEYGIISESAERFTFIALTLLLIPISFFIILISTKYEIFILKNKLIFTSIYFLFILFQFLIIVNFVLEFLIIKPKIFDFVSKESLIFLISLTSVLLIYLISKKSIVKIFINKKLDHFLFIFFILLSIFCVISWRVFSVFSIDNSWSMVNHLGAVLYSISQVVEGKHVLVDLPAQYGLYSEILYPIFKIIGLSVLNFTLVMAALQILSMILILRVIFQVIKNNLFRVLCILSLFSIVGYNWAAPTDPYFQYYPLRFLFPALSIAIYWSFINNQSNLKVFILGAISSISLLFNFDTGVPVFGSIVAGLIFSYFFSFSTNKSLIKKISYILIFFISTIFTMFFLIFLIYNGENPEWLLLFKYQNFFYITGAYMLPIPKKLDFWILVILVYITGIVTYLNYAYRGFYSRSLTLIFHLSILGIGLFAYFQGRSHFYVLMTCFWPAILIIFILMDRIVRSTYLGFLPLIFNILIYPFIFLGIFLSSVLFLKSFDMTNTMNNNLESLILKKSTPVTRNIEFIQHSVFNSSSVVIYCSELGIANSVKGPGIAELIIYEDIVFFVNYLMEGNVQDIFIEPNKLYIDEKILKLFDGPFKEINRSVDGLIHLRLKE